MEHKQYDRQKTLAVVTGLTCCLVFAGGTALGSYHAITTIGIAAGLLAIASYILADIAVAWAAYIDYHEDQNAMEWASWAVKYIVSFYLLFSGGCIAFAMFDLATDITSRGAAIERR